MDKLYEAVIFVLVLLGILTAASSIPVAIWTRDGWGGDLPPRLLGTGLAALAIGGLLAWWSE